MTPEAITARNRANAAKSTGPRSDAGKAAVAQNARRHGATARPDPERVASWVRIILDTPDLEAGQLLADDARTRSALTLAVAEARLAEATRALEDFEAGRALPSDVESSIEERIIVTRSFMDQMPTPAQAFGTDLSPMERFRTVSVRKPSRSRRHRLLKRYWREARAQRKRAFEEWLNSLQAQGRSFPAREKREIPKQSQMKQSHMSA